MRQPFLVLAALLSSCVSPESVTDTEVDSVPTDDTEGDTQATGDDTEATGDTEVDWTGYQAETIEAELTDVLTVVRVTWTTTESTSGYVEFGEDESYGLVTPTTDAGTTHEVLLLGNGSDRDIHFRVVTVAGDTELPSDDYSIATGTLPGELPELTVTGTVEHWQGYQALPNQGTGHSVVIIDTRGEVVWYHVIDEPWNVMRAAVTPQGEVAIGLAGVSDADKEEGVIRYVSMDGSETRDVEVPYFDHDFTMLPDGTMAAIVLSRNFCCTEVADSIVEIDSSGAMTTIWDAWDQLDYETYGGRGGSNWTHANALDYSAEDDAYFVSLKDIGTIAKVDRSTGETLWLLNGDANEFTFPDGEQPVDYQHQFDRVDGGLVIFANELPDAEDSQAVELALDEEALTAEYVWRYSHDPGLNVFAKGDVHVLDDDAVQVVWSSSGEIENVTREGEVVWRLNTSLGYGFTFTTFAETLYATE